eukprot:gb/GECH01011030.1/.p1 GENE.gb/GECH01011030.1/~~gb/GECH01011030.1/.p1  ORF type:complete len:873 (+),score=77.86 gb/GECH01011030.1/:1-2619(+)
MSQQHTKELTKNTFLNAYSLAVLLSPTFQNREHSICKLGTSFYYMLYGLFDKVSRAYKTYFLAQYFGSGKTRFIRELKPQLNRLQTQVRENIKRPFMDETLFKTLLDLKVLEINCETIETDLIEVLQTRLNLDNRTNFHSFTQIFKQYICVNNISQKNKKLLVITLDEFNLEKVTNVNRHQTHKENLTAFWEKTHSSSMRVSQLGLGVIWLFCGRDVTFWDVIGDGSRGSPTISEWIVLETLKEQHVGAIIKELENKQQIRSNIVSDELRPHLGNIICSFTGGVPRSICVVIQVLHETNITFSTQDGLSKQMKNIAKYWALSNPGDFTGFADFTNTSILICALFFVQVVDQFKIPFNETDHYTIAGFDIPASKLVNHLPVFIYSEGDLEYLSLPPLQQIGLAERFNQLRPYLFNSVFPMLHGLPKQCLDCGETLEYILITSVSLFSLIAQNQKLKALFPWLDDHDRNENISPLTYQYMDTVSKADDTELTTTMKGGADLVAVPKSKSRSADIYLKLGKDIGIAIQAKNGQQELTWNKVKKELEKMGQFSPLKTYYTMISMCINSKMKQMLSSDTDSLTLPPGKYYFTNQSNHALVRCHRDEFSLLVNTNTYQLHQASNTNLNPLFIHPHKLSCTEYDITPTLAKQFNQGQCFTVPENSYLVILGTKQIQKLISETNYDSIKRLWVDKSVSNTVMNPGEFLLNLTSIPHITHLPISRKRSWLELHPETDVPPPEIHLSDAKRRYKQVTSKNDTGTEQPSIEEPPTKRSRIEETPELASSGGTGTEQRDYTGAVNFNSKGKGITSWSVEQVADWMKTIGNGKFADCSDTAIKEEIDGDVLAKLTKKETKDWFGVTIGKASKLCDAIQEEVSKSS